MNKEKINKYFAKLMGKCWHDFKDSINGRTCIHCGEEFWTSEVEKANDVHNVFNHFKLRTILMWCEKQKWWPDFVKKYGQIKSIGPKSDIFKIDPVVTYLLPINLVTDIELFISTLYEFLTNESIKNDS